MFTIVIGVRLRIACLFVCLFVQACIGHADKLRLYRGRGRRPEEGNWCSRPQTVYIYIVCIIYSIVCLRSVWQVKRWKTTAAMTKESHDLTHGGLYYRCYNTDLHALPQRTSAVNKQRPADLLRPPTTTEVVNQSTGKPRAPGHLVTAAFFTVSLIYKYNVQCTVN